MNAAHLLTHFDRLAEAPDAVPRLRRLVLELAIRGKLVEQDSAEEPAHLQLVEITAARALKVGDSKPRQRKAPSQNAASDSPFPLPAGWSVAPLAGLTDVLNGRAYAKNELLDAGTPVLRVGNLFTSKHWYYSNLELDQDKYCDQGDLIFSWSASFGPFIWSGPKVIYHYHIWKLPLHSEAHLNKHYLYRFLLQQTQQIKDSGHGVSMVHMTKEKMEKLLVPVPPLAEQHRIVAKVDELMALCDQLEAAQQERERRRDRLAAASLQRLNQPPEANPATDQTEPAQARQQAQREQQKDHARFHLQNLNRLTTRPEHIKAMRQTAMGLAVRGLLDKQDPRDQSAHALLAQMRSLKLNMIEVGDIPKSKETKPISSEECPASLPPSWAWTRIEAVCAVIVDCPHSTATFVPQGIVCLDTNSFKNGSITPHKARYVSEDTYQERIKRLAPRGGDIVFAREGSVGESVIVPDGMRCCLGQRVMLFRPLPGIDPAFFQLALSEPSSLARLLSLHKGVGAKHVNVADMRNALLPLPPLAEQHRIVAKVDELMALCDQLEAQLTQSQTDSRRLLEAVLEAALTPA